MLKKSILSGWPINRQMKTQIKAYIPCLILNNKEGHDRAEQMYSIMKTPIQIY